jgi:hypothetical protein
MFMGFNFYQDHFRIIQDRFRKVSGQRGLGVYESLKLFSELFVEIFLNIF